MSMAYPHPGYGRKAEQLDDEEDAHIISVQKEVICPLVKMGFYLIMLRVSQVDMNSKATQLVKIAQFRG
jgi:hypothetical protein